LCGPPLTPSRRAGGKDIFDDTQINGAKFPTTTLGYSMIKITCLDDALSENFELRQKDW